MIKKLALFICVFSALMFTWSGVANACGGFFCLNDPVDQTGERIVFTTNSDDTITALIEIQYQGEAADFSWILPIPEAITADDLQVPEDGQLVFDELHQMTDVQIIAPDSPECADMIVAEVAMLEEEAMEDSGVEIFASGEVGPFGFDVIGSEDPDALINWLRDSNYRVTPEMEPLIDIYVDQEMAFVAMRLLDGETAESIQPIEITYGGTEPMIPLQLTAVAAQQNMPIWVWIFGEERAVPTNFAEMEIANEEISFFPFGSNDYVFLVQERANALDGQAFITEYAQEVSAADFTHSWLDAQTESASYLTRLSTYIDPDEMTADPTFGFDGTLGDVSNVRDASDLEGLYDCERNGDGDGILDAVFGGSSDAIDPFDGGPVVVAFTPEALEAADTDETADPDSPDADETAAGATDGESSSNGILLIVLGAIGAVLIGGVGFAAGRSRNSA